MSMKTRLSFYVSSLIVMNLCTICSAQEKVVLSHEKWVAGNGATKNKEVLTIDVPDDSKVGDLITGLKEPLILDPGVYTVTAIVKAEPLQNMGYRIVLSVRDEKSKPYPGWRPPWQELTPRTKERWVATDEARAFQHDKDGFIKLEAAFVVLEKGSYQVSVGWKIGEYGSHTAKTLSASLKKLSLHSLSCIKNNRNVFMGTLTADKVIYKPGMSPKLQVPVFNSDMKETNLVCKVAMSKDLRDPVIVVTKEITMKPGTKDTITVTLPALNEFGGYRFDLQLWDGDKLIQTVERAAAVSDSYHRIGINGIPLRTYLAGRVGLSKARIDDAFTSYKDSYIVMQEHGTCWAPDDFQGLAPKKDRWASCLYWRENKQTLKWISDAARRNGIGYFAYLKGHNADGRDGWLWAQKHPDLILYDDESGQAIGRYDMDRFLNHKGYEEKLFSGKKVNTYWGYCYTDTTRPSIVDICARSTIDSIKMFGWAGVRFDGDFLVLPEHKHYDGRPRNLRGKVVASEKEFDYVWATQIKRYEKQVKRVFPQVEFGYNSGFVNDAHLQKYCAISAMASDGGMVMNEAIRGRKSRDNPNNPWTAFSDTVVHDSRKIRFWGGFYQLIAPYGMRADDNLYQTVYTLAAQAKPTGPYFFNTPFAVRLSRFVVRYAGILCGDLFPVPSPDSRFDVAGSGPLDWKNYVSYLDIFPQRRDYVMQLINPPVLEKCDTDDGRCLLRAPVRNVRISINTDAYESPVKAWFIDPWVDGKKEVKLTPRPGGAELELPHSVSIWSVVVIECELKENK